ncbi:MAG: glycosyltransferase [Candidatus Obscuribacterales bacterium]|nr:glycosyltransferase [Candidatus Obscuribacterales bacterium]
MVDISVVINCHNEGRQLKQTITSVRDNIEACKHESISVELIVVRDSADLSTIDYTEQDCKKDARLLDAQLSDLGLARNFGASAARGKYLAFIDGDDLWCRSWLISAFKQAEAYRSRSILHTETAVLFDAEEKIWRLQDSESADFDRSILLDYNPWYPSSFGRRDIYLEFPYCPVDLEGGFFYEDWHWNCETLYAGIPHKTVPETFHCYRTKSIWKEPSLLAAASLTQCIMPATKLFSLGYQNTNR